MGDRYRGRRKKERGQRVKAHEESSIDGKHENTDSHTRTKKQKAKKIK